MPEFKTIEEAQAEIIRLQEVNTALTTERDTLSQNNETLTADNERLRTLNQSYFNKLSAFYAPTIDPDPDPDQDQVDLEAYAKTLTF